MNLYGLAVLMVGFGLALLILDVAVRRWENVMGMWEVVTRRG